MNFDIQIVNIHDYNGEYYYVGRGSPLGNPFSDKPSKFDVMKTGSRKESIEKYKEWIEERLLYNTPQRRAIEECVNILISRNKIVLGCFCKPKPCHAEVISEILMNKVLEIDNKWGIMFE